MFHCYIIYISLWSVAAHFLLIFYEVWCLFSSNAFLWMFAPMFFSLIVSNLKRKYPAFNSGKILDTSCMEICRIFMVTGCHFNPKWKVTPWLFKDRNFQKQVDDIEMQQNTNMEHPPSQENSNDRMLTCFSGVSHSLLHYFQLGLQ